MGCGSSSWMKRLLGLNREARLLFLGYDGSGKTTTVYRLKVGKRVTTVPSLGFNVERINYKNFSFITWDVGGEEQVRPHWKYYYKDTDAVILVVDSTDRKRMSALRRDVHKAMAAEELKDAVILVLVNKQDLEDALSKDEVVDRLGLADMEQQWAAFGCSATFGDGLHDGLDWLVEVLIANAPPEIDAPTDPVCQPVVSGTNATTSAKAEKTPGRLTPTAVWFKQLRSGSVS